MFAGLLSAAVSIGKGFFDDYQLSRENKRDIAKAITENKIRLALNEQVNNQAWEMAQIEGKDKFLRRVSFFMLSAPFMVAIIAPESVNDYFTVALAAMPEWYQWLYMSIIGAVWGISEFKKWKA
jgi:hypothetical protein